MLCGPPDTYLFLQKSGAVPERVPKRLPRPLSPRGHRAGTHGNKSHLPSLPGTVLTHTSRPHQPDRHGGIQALGSRSDLSLQSRSVPEASRRPHCTDARPGLVHTSAVLKLVPVTLVRNPPSRGSCLMNRRYDSMLVNDRIHTYVKNTHNEMTN